MKRASACHTLAVLAVAACALAAAVAPLAAQYPSAYLVPGGALRLGFEPELNTWDQRFGRDGALEPLGLDYTADSAGPAFLPSLQGPEQAVRSITGDASYRVNAGAVSTRLDADVRRFPFTLALGITDRITLTASLPIVTTRMQVTLTSDSGDANVGWNQAAEEAGNAAGLSQIQRLLAELAAGAIFLEAQIAAGAFGCPTSALCDQARDLAARTGALRDQLILLTGVGAANGTPLPPFAPLASSSSGQAVLAAITSLGAELATFGAAAPTVTLPLPSQRVAPGDFNRVLSGAGFGYDALPLDFVKLRNSVGDAEVGLRIGLVQQPAFRAVLSTTVRLPTGQVDSPNHFADLGSGDAQTDLEGGLELAVEPGTVVALALASSYTRQLAQTLTRRITVPERPIALAAAQASVRRDLGDVFRASAYPSLRLSRALRVYLAAHYLKKLRDEVTLVGDGPAPSGFPGAEPVEALEQETEMEILHLGGGVYFRADRDARGPRLPIEAGIDYRTAFDGRGGQAPKATRVNFFLRLYWRLWGARER